MTLEEIILNALIDHGHTQPVATATLATYAATLEAEAYRKGFRDGQSAGPGPSSIEELIESGDDY